MALHQDAPRPLFPAKGRAYLRAVLVAGLLGLIAGPPPAAETHDLHIYAYCAPDSNFCGFGSEAAWELRVLESVQVANEIWKVTGKSFRPVLHGIDTTRPDFHQTTGCNSGDARNPRVCEDLITPCGQGNLCTGIGNETCNLLTVCEDLTQACQQYCEDRTTPCSGDGDCVGIGAEQCRFSPVCDDVGDGLCLTLNQQQRWRWRKEVALQHPDAVAMMLTSDPNTCCSNIPVDGDPENAFYGISCDAARNSFQTGAIWAHELGHHFCLAHTFTGLDFADTMPHEPNHDGDTTWVVGDTPADPSTREGNDVFPAQCLDGTPCSSSADCGMFNTPCAANVGRLNREWCNFTASPGLVDDDSPQPNLCTSTCVRCTQASCDQASDYTVLGYDPDEHAVMSYYGSKCVGPVVVNGQRLREGFSQESVARILDCENDFPQLDKVDVCHPFGDSDSDGICDLDDNCPFVANTSQANDDGDDYGGDACDLCWKDPLPTGDLDGDGLGDICDDDMDGDSCDNEIDDHPAEANPVTGSVTFFGCGPDGAPVTTYEGSDTDGDLVPNCEDLDDDNDGICDGAQPQQPAPMGQRANGVPAGGCVAGPDECPTTTGTCHRFEEGAPCPPEWSSCLGGGCRESFIRVYAPVNPDPTEVLFEQVQILNGTLFVRGLPGMTTSESALLAGANGPAISAAAAGSASRSFGAVAYRMELWSRRTGELVDVIVEQFFPEQVEFGALSRGGTIAITPFPEGSDPALRIDVRFAPGAAEGEPGPDADGDGRPDGYDNCIYHENPLQRDRDGDGYGDRCDADFNGDRDVDETDFDFLLGCVGVDPDLPAPLSEPQEIGGTDQPQPDPQALIDSIRCAIADLNGDGSIDDGDLAEATLLLNAAPGPSGVAPDGGAESPGRLAAPIVMDKVGGQVVVRWEPGCGDGANFAVYQGSLASPGSHVPLTCVDTDQDRQESIPASSGDHYYLVVVTRDGVEGSFGSDSRGELRPPAAFDRCEPVWVPRDVCPE